ncbi:MAG: reprolysin-like metallopeptidase, partial [Bacteroidota bacterium]
MRLLLRCLLIGLITFSFDFQAHAQWQTIDKNAIPNHLSQELSPNRSQLLLLDLPAIEQLLAQAPHESQVSLSQSNLIVELPQADGSTRAFRLIEYNALAPGLMAKFPGLHTYYGEAVSNTRIRVRVDISVKGLRVMGVSEEGQWFVDPYAKGNTEYYIAYAKADYPVTKAWHCDFDQSLIRPSGNATTSSRAGDCQFRVYRLAIAARGEYTNYHGGVAGTIAELANVVNRLNEMYERDLSVRFELIANNDLIIYTNAGTDPYTGGVFTNLAQNQSNLDAVIGAANYDVGHVVGSGGGGGVASYGSICDNGQKARGATSLGNPIGDPFVIDYVAHELGHQFGGSHTQNNNCNRVNS